MQNKENKQSIVNQKRIFFKVYLKWRTIWCATYISSVITRVEKASLKCFLLKKIKIKINKKLKKTLVPNSNSVCQCQLDKEKWLTLSSIQMRHN